MLFQQNFPRFHNNLRTSDDVPVLSSNRAMLQSPITTTTDEEEELRSRFPFPIPYKVTSLQRFSSSKFVAIFSFKSIFLIKSLKILLRKAMWVNKSMQSVQKKTIPDFKSKGCLHVKTDQNNGQSQPRKARWSWTTWGRIKLQRHHTNTLWRHTIQSVRCRQPRPGKHLFI